MKTVKRIFWISILVLLLIAGIRVLVDTIAEESYADKMQDMNIKTAKGSLVAGYDVEEEVYTRKYIPKELLAKKPGDVGYLLKLSYGTTGASYSGGHFVTGKTITAHLVDCDTGEVLFEHTFEPYFPQTVSTKTKSVSVDSDVVERWLTHVYPEWPAGKDVGHDYGPNGCWICGQLPDAPAPTEPATESPTVPETTTAATNPTEADPAAVAQSLITGQWKLDFIMDAETYDLVPFDGTIKFQINKDHSAFITTPDGRSSYEWVYNFVDYENGDPDLYTYFYLLIDKDGNELFFTYYYDNTVAIFTDEHSVFFVR